MDTPNDGGPAYPGFSHTNGHGSSKLVPDPNGGVNYENYEPGMSFRDRAAISAMQAIIPSGGHDHLCIADMAKLSYQYADALIAARTPES